MKTVMYELTIYAPDSGYDVCIKFTSPLPFAAIHTGDLLNPRVWDLTEEMAEAVQGKVLLVRCVDHFIFEIGETISNKMMVFTAARLDRDEARRHGQKGSFDTQREWRRGNS